MNDTNTTTTETDSSTNGGDESHVWPDFGIGPDDPGKRTVWHFDRLGDIHFVLFVASVVVWTPSAALVFAIAGIGSYAWAHQAEWDLVDAPTPDAGGVA